MAGLRIGWGLPRFLLAAVASTLAVGVIGQFPPEALDRALLLRINPDEVRRAADLAMLLLADFSVPATAVVFVGWELAYQVRRRYPAAGAWLPAALLAAGLVAAIVLTAVALTKPPAERVHFFFMAPLSVLGFWIAGRSIRRDDQAALERLHQTFVASLAAGLTAAVARETIGDLLAFRPRPLSPSFYPWNQALREVLGETVRTGSSYVSGHATALFALLTPLILRSRRRSVQLALLLWACLHAYTRLYLAAHFPFGVMMGSLLGIALGVLATGLLLEDGLSIAPRAGAGVRERAS